MSDLTAHQTITPEETQGGDHMGKGQDTARAYHIVLSVLHSILSVMSLSSLMEDDRENT